MIEIDEIKRRIKNIYNEKIYISIKNSDFNLYNVDIEIDKYLFGFNFMINSIDTVEKIIMNLEQKIDSLIVYIYKMKVGYYE